MTDLIPLLLGIGISGIIALIAFSSKRIAILPSIQAVKDAYPIINTAIMTAATLTNGSPYDFLFDAAAAVWSGPGIDNEDAAKLVEAAIAYFSKQKYISTNFQQLDPEAIARGKAIGAQIAEGLTKTND